MAELLEAPWGTLPTLVGGGKGVHILHNPVTQRIVTLESRTRWDAQREA